MRKINKAYTSLYVSIVDPNRRELVDSLSRTNKAVFTVLAATSIAFTSIELYKKAFGEVVVPSEDTINDILEISKDLVFTINEITHVDIDYMLNTVRSVLNRVYPVIDITVDTISSYNNLFGNSNLDTISTETIDIINNEPYTSSAIFKTTKKLYASLLNSTAEYNAETSTLNFY